MTFKIFGVFAFFKKSAIIILLAMGFSWTGIIYIYASLVSAFMAWRFYRFWKEEKNLISKIFFYLMTASFIMFMGDGLFGGLIFLYNEKIHNLIVLLTALLAQPLISAFLGYLAVYFKFPRISPSFGFLAMLLVGLAGGILTIFYPPQISLEPSGFLSWQNHPLVAVFRALQVFLPMIVIATAFFQLSGKLTEPGAKTRALGFGAAFSLAILTFGLEFIVSILIAYNPAVFDLAVAGLFSIFLLTSLLVPRVGYAPLRAYQPR